ncbi:hypothetical protein H6801_00835 [Candidatus Nomurabacteria bacterium]|nr:hypothetical protein [Candidatus Nomurabacteria bacterium]
MQKNKKLGFFCFSPPVMIATFAIEIALLVLILLQRKINHTAKLIIASLFFLALFQLCEYFVCGGMGVGALQWSRLGFIAITTLPPLGLHLIHSIANKKSGYIVWSSYVLMMLWILAFGFSETIFSGHECVSNYVIFQLHDLVGYAYSAYYYGLLLLGIALALKFGEKVKQKNQKEALYGMIIGYLVFLLPTAIANTISPETMAGIPSIMCGFAVIFALILFFYIIPRVTKPKN